MYVQINQLQALILRKSLTWSSEEMEEKEVCYHVPVMLHESLEGLDIQPLYITYLHYSMNVSKDWISDQAEYMSMLRSEEVDILKRY